MFRIAYPFILNDSGGTDMKSISLLLVILFLLLVLGACSDFGEKGAEDESCLDDSDCGYILKCQNGTCVGTGVPEVCDRWCGFVENASKDQRQPYSESGCKWGCMTGYESASFCDCGEEYQERYDCYLYYLDDDYDVAACALGFSGDGVCGSKDSGTWGDIVSDDCDNDIDDYNDCISDCRPL